MRKLYCNKQIFLLPIATILGLVSCEALAGYEGSWFYVGSGFSGSQTYVNTKPISTSYGFFNKTVTVLMMNKSVDSTQVYNTSINCKQRSYAINYPNKEQEWREIKPGSVFDTAAHVVCD